MYINLKYIVIHLILLTFLPCYSDDGVIVDTSLGKIIGKRYKSLIYNVDYNGFLGIPYAKAPVRQFRFLPPVPHEGWNDVLHAVKEKEPCVQLNHNIRRGSLFHQTGKENCLYLNIYTPASNKTSSTKNPVLVFIYNEHFRNSYNSSQYGPDFFIEEGVIIVHVHHRLSSLGFISTEDEVLPGNAGLKDVILGLKWIRDNIAQFNGDPDRTTLIGVQGGAVAVDLLLHCSKSKGLFNKVILQSGSSFSSMYLQKNLRQRAFKLAEKLNRASSSSDDLLKNLNDATVEEILKKEFDALPEEYTLQEQKGILAFSPVIEKDLDGLLTEYPEKKVDRMNVPIMIGFNSREGMDSALQYLNEPKYLSFQEKYFRLYLPIRTEFNFDSNDDAYLEAVNDVKKFYFSKARVSINRPSEYLTYIGDAVNMYAIDYAVRKYVNDSVSPVFYYHFDYSGALNENKNILLKMSTVSDGTWGAATGDELCYLFVCPKLKRQYIELNKSNSEEISVLRNLVRMWANFVKYGNPTPNEDLQGFQWLPYTKEDKKYLHIGNVLKMKENLYLRRFKFWDEFIDKWRKHAVDGIVKLPKNYVREDL